MMKRTNILNLILTALACILCLDSLISCNKGLPEEDLSGADRVLLFYAAGLNNLSYDINDNINKMLNGYVPGPKSDAVLLVFSNLAKGNKLISPSLTRITKDRYGKITRDTLMTMTPGTLAADANTLRTVLDNIMETYPGKQYSMIFSSHSTGWLPAGKKIEPEFFNNKVSPTAIGNEYEPGTTRHTYEIDLKDFADAIPAQMEFIIFDSCLMGGVEVAYQLRDKCGKVIFSPTEVISEGFDYSQTTKYILKQDIPDLQGICKDYYNLYNSKTGDWQSATISLVDCRKTEELASVCRDIFASHRDKLDTLDPVRIQCYGRMYEHLFFYDLGDIIRHLDVSKEESEKFDRAISDCVIYKAATENFIGMPITEFCGLSSYVTNKKVHDSYYRTLDWNKATGMIR